MLHFENIKLGMTDIQELSKFMANKCDIGFTLYHIRMYAFICITSGYKTCGSYIDCNNQNTQLHS